MRTEHRKTPLLDVCKYIDNLEAPDCEIPIRLLRDRSILTAFTRDPVLPEMYLQPRAAPVPLRELLENNLLSAQDKISLAFTLAKSVWQYYDSDLMKTKWDLETIKILRQIRLINPNTDHEHRMPFLEIKPSNLAAIWCEQETQIRRENKEVQEMHPYPYILTLGMLLVQICLPITPKSIVVPPLDAGNNIIYLYYKKQMETEEASWPVLDLRDEYRNVYRKIVVNCIPGRKGEGPLFSPKLDAVSRRNMLMEHVVGPLYNLLSHASGASSGVVDKPNTKHRKHVTWATETDTTYCPERYAICLD